MLLLPHLRVFNLPAVGVDLRRPIVKGPGWSVKGLGWFVKGRAWGVNCTALTGEGCSLTALTTEITEQLRSSSS